MRHGRQDIRVSHQPALGELPRQCLDKPGLNKPGLNKPGLGELGLGGLVVHD
jgi:hypothetical protein